jgi:acyl carrier protein phosphodiesterase
LNFLAHIFLSGNDEQLMIGNFIADFVKGKKKNDYPDRIREGIELHRNIDDFTDHHPVTDISKNRLRPKYGKYSGVIVDLYYDHFLAKDFSRYSDVSLHDYSEKTYAVIRSYDDILPEGVRFFLPFMIERNWLLNYATIDGIGRALSGLSKRVSFENKMDASIEDLREQYADFEKDFNQFFPELITFAAARR